MKKARFRLLSLILTLTICATSFAVFSPISHAENAKADDMTAYDALYVGADGSQTQNGGKLTALYSAFSANDASVDFENERWYDKVGANDLTIMGGAKSEKNPSGWTYLADGGFGYSEPDFTDGADNYLYANHEILGERFEIETVAATHLRNIEPETEHIKPLFSYVQDGRRIFIISATSNWQMYMKMTVNFKGTPGTVFTPSCTISQNADMSSSTVLNGSTLTIGEDGTLTAEVTYRYANIVLSVPDGTTVTGVTLPKISAEACSTTSFVFGSLYLMTWTNLTGSNAWGNGFGTTRYYVGKQAWTHGQLEIEWRDAKTFQTLDNSVATLRVVKDEAGYTVTHNELTAFTSAADKVSLIPNSIAFRLFHNFPADAYAVRVYSAPLTEEERAHNHLIDLMAYSAFSVDDFIKLDSEERAAVAAQVAGLKLSEDKEALRRALSAAIVPLAAEDTDAESLFYVSEGLVGLYTYYDGLSSSCIYGENEIRWLNALDKSQTAALYGNGWKMAENGGFIIERDLSAWNADKQFGIRLDYDQLPEDDYTVEITVNPYGIHDYDDNGNKTRYVDTTSKHGTFADYGYALGPLRAMSFATVRTFGKDGQLEKRWVYLSKGCWNTWCNDYGSARCLWDDSWSGISEDRVLTYAIALDESNQAKGKYVFFNDAMPVGSFSVPNETVSFIDKQSAEEQRFELFNHVPGTVFAIRIYNRVLNESELLRNRVADLIYYYDLDTTVLESILASTENQNDIYKQLGQLEFNMSASEAQAAFDRILTSYFVQFGGFGVRKDVPANEGIRYYFDLSDERINALKASGLKVEIGAVANVGKNTAPTLAEGAHDYMIRAYDQSTKAFFMDEDTFALTVRYLHMENASAEMYLTSVRVRGYVRLTDSEGNERVFYVETNDADTPVDSLFAAYQLIQAKAKEEPLASHVGKVLSTTYEQVIYEVSEDKYTLAEAAALAEQSMKAAKKPTQVIIRIANGMQHVTSPVTISGEGFDFPYAQLIIEGAGENAALSTTLPIDAQDFEQCGENRYVYRFQKDKNGAYPDFRYLYVDGQIAEISASGALRAATREQSLTVFNCTSEGKFYLPSELVEPLRSRYASAQNARTCLSGTNILMHIVTQWDYNIVHLSGIDFNDYQTDSTGKRHYAVYVDSEEYESFCIPKNNTVMNRPVFLTGHEDFLDKEGEFHYDASTGTLLYYTGKNILEQSFSYPTADNLLILENITKTTVRNLRFTGTDDLFLTKNGHTGGQSGRDLRFSDFPDRAAVLIRSSRGLKVENCTFEELACEGLSGRGRLENITVTDCTFTEIGSSALRLGNIVYTWNDLCGLDNILIENNTFHTIASVYRNSSALHFASARDLTVRNNTIGGCSYSAISAGWRWAAVEWSGALVGEAPFVNLYNVSISENYIYDFMTEMVDGGAIYVLGGNVGRDTESYLNAMEKNHIVFTKTTGNGLGGMVCGIYLDACSSHWLISENVIAEQSAEADVDGTVANRQRARSYYIYLQHVGVDAPVYRVLCEKNAFLGVRASAEAMHSSGISLQEYEVFRTYVNEDNFVFAKDNAYIRRVSSLPLNVISIILDAGAEGEKGSEVFLENNDY